MLMNHIDERTLELFVLGAHEVSERRKEIAEHIASCAGCRESFREMSGYYNEVQQLSEEFERGASEALVVRSVMLDPGQTGRAPGVPSGRLPLRARVVLFAIRHPLTSSVSVVGLFLAAVLLVNIVRFPKDLNPSYARALNEFLVVYNKEGDELWRKHVGPGFDQLTPGRAGGYLSDETTTIVDLDGDGRNEVVCAFGRNQNWLRFNTVRCYDPSGGERWAYEIHRSMVFGTQTFPDSYAAQYVFSGDYDRDGKVEVYVVASKTMFYPTAVMKLDGKTGTLMSEYWHSGNLIPQGHTDTDADGIEDLVFVGQNNAMRRAVFLILDPRHVTGHGPSPPEYTPQGIPRGAEKHYVVFPPSELASISDKWGYARGLTREDKDAFYIIVGEPFRDRIYSLLYHFNGSLLCTRVEATDEYATLRRQLQANGTLPSIPDSVYYQKLRQDVKYWKNDKLVKPGTGDLRY